MALPTIKSRLDRTKGRESLPQSPVNPTSSRTNTHHDTPPPKLIKPLASLILANESRKRKSN